MESIGDVLKRIRVAGRPVVDVPRTPTDLALEDCARAVERRRRVPSELVDAVDEAVTGELIADRVHRAVLNLRSK
jgi:hypothetical protein